MINSLRALKVINKFFLKKKVEGRKSAFEYAEAEYKWAMLSKNLHNKYFNVENKVILDAGCGLGGRTLFYAENNPKEIYAVDIDENHINYAKMFAKSKNVNINFFVANLIDLPFDSDMFDLIIMNDVVEHIKFEFLENSFLELKRVLKPDGEIF